MNTQRLSLDEQLTLVRAHWKYPGKYQSKIVVTQVSKSHYTIGRDKSDQQLLAELIKDEKNKSKSFFNLFKSIFKKFKFN